MPRTFPFMTVDAFTTQPLSGNACAIVFDADELDADTMLAIARDLNMSETSFVLRPDAEWVMSTRMGPTLSSRAMVVRSRSVRSLSRPLSTNAKPVAMVG